MFHRSRNAQEIPVKLLHGGHPIHTSTLSITVFGHCFLGFLFGTWQDQPVEKAEVKVYKEAEALAVILAIHMACEMRTK